MFGLFWITPGFASRSSSANHLICSTWSPQRFSTNPVVSVCNPQLQGSCVFATWRRFWSLTALFWLYSDIGVAHGSSVLSAKVSTGGTKQNRAATCTYQWSLILTFMTWDQTTLWSHAFRILHYESCAQQNCICLLLLATYRSSFDFKVKGSTWRSR